MAAKVTEITPDTFLCGTGNCPSVFEAENGDLYIIGKVVGDALPGDVKSKVGADEHAVLVPRGLIKGLSLVD